MNRNRVGPIAQALLAALLFGASAPFAKLLLGEIEPILLAGLLYLGSGIGLLGIQTCLRTTQPAARNEAPIRRSDFPWLAGALLAGGVAAPITLLFSLRITPAATATLLLNFEGVATTLIAALAFKESIGRRAWGAIGLIAIASVLLSINGKANWGLSLGAIGVLAACVLWGIDNNLTRAISGKDPLKIASIKGLGAGSFSLGFALIAGNQFPGAGVILGAMILGCLSYGVSIALFIRAMRGLGAARTSVLFGTAPLSGIILSVLLFQELPNWPFVLALLLMAIGTGVLLSERHEHHHAHDMTIHEHSHVHDDGHHQHGHDGEYTELHSHAHQHDDSPHVHDHMPDIHHRHVHRSES
jgi:drug/metabolite transporter (DMT)-like permease